VIILSPLFGLLYDKIDKTINLVALATFLGSLGHFSLVFFDPIFGLIAVGFCFGATLVGVYRRTVKIIDK
jgi:hypothetical protein